MKTVGFGVNMKYNELDGFERVATFENKEAAFAAFYLLSQSSEYKETAMALEVEEIFEDNFGGYEYKTLATRRILRTL